tara:strand:+ start:1644 stop:2291 length:648 start_codon:yes stop_codon:yes gene_type:complete
MAITNYDTLKTTAADYLHRTDLSDDVMSNFVQLGEARINRKLRLLEQEAVSTLTLASGANNVALPAKWIETIDVIYADDKRNIQPQNIRDLNAQRTYDTAASRPYLYATTNGTIIFEIKADQEYSILLNYFEKWDIAADTTNYLLTNAPDAYLYATLLEAKAYIKSMEDVALWSQGLQTAIDDLNRLDNRSRRNATTRLDNVLVGQGRFNINRGY